MATAPMTLAIRIINDYRAAQCLWDKKHPDYNDKAARRREMQGIARKYGMGESEMEKKLHNLRSQFARELKAVREARKNNTTVQKRMWFGYRRMLFLVGAEGSRHRTPVDPWSDASDDNAESDLETLRSAKAESDQDSDGTDHDFDDLTASEAGSSCNSTERVRREVTAQAKQLAAPHSTRAASELSDQIAPSAAKRSEETGREWDEFDAYGKYVTQKLRNCNKSRVEIAVAQRDIEEVFIKLEVGVYASPEAQGKERVFLA